MKYSKPALAALALIAIPAVSIHAGESEVGYIATLGSSNGAAGPQTVRAGTLSFGSGPNAVSGIIRLSGVSEASSTLYIGVELIPVDTSTRKLFKLPETGGLLITGISPGSPADGKLGQGDILLKIGDQIVMNREQIRSLLGAHKNGDEVTLAIVRGGRTESVVIKLAPLPESAAIAGPGALRIGRAPDSEVLKQLTARTQAMARQAGVTQDRLNMATGATTNIPEHGTIIVGNGVSGAGTFILSGPNTHSGAATVSSGTFTIGKAQGTPVLVRSASASVDGGTRTSSVTFPEGTVTVLEGNGKKTVTVEDESGKTLNKGELNDATKAALPEWAKRALDHMASGDILQGALPGSEVTIGTVAVGGDGAGDEGASGPVIGTETGAEKKPAGKEPSKDASAKK